MFKRKFLGFSLVAAALLSWQIMPASVGTANSGIADPCSSSTKIIAGGGPYCVIVCPQGDQVFDLASQGATIEVIAKDNTGAAIAGILATDFWLVGATNGLVLCGGSACIDADSASSIAGRTTISGAMAASLYDLAGVKVVIQGTVVNKVGSCGTHEILPIKFVSADITGNGFADSGDFAIYAPIHFGAYNEKADFNCDGFVNGGDFALIGPHVAGAGHQCN